ncbi:hypothetical protein HMPREF9095_1096 [Haemophilus aegyptius ATCC 11116]|nr:hypothetical protein HMPREF9095_1096 [Haemophilus aegyptius ATCC 11116]
MLNKHKLVKIQPIRKILFYAKGFTLIVVELTIDVKDKTEKKIVIKVTKAPWV